MRAQRLFAVGWVAVGVACAAGPTPRATSSSVPSFASLDSGVDVFVENPPGPSQAGALAVDAAAESASLAANEVGDAARAVPESEDAGAAPSPGSTSACNEQSPQDFLVRGIFLQSGQEGIRRSIQYRTDTYGYFKGFGRAAPDAAPPSSFVVSTRFMGLPVRMHRKVVPALRCVEERIHADCADHPYTPQALAGVRFRNTYRGGEVTNHIYGIAIDIDPARNTCCGCVPPWNDAPACKRPGKSEYDHMDMPECWVHAFERYGFYWLGHDRLKDTMHFEFLGDPDHIVRGESHRSDAGSP